MPDLVNESWTTHHGRVRWRLSTLRPDDLRLDRKPETAGRWLIVARFESSEQASAALALLRAPSPPLPSTPIPGEWGPEPRSRFMESRQAWHLEQVWVAKNKAQTLVELDARRVVTDREREQIRAEFAHFPTSWSQSAKIAEIVKSTGLARSTIYGIVRGSKASGLEVLDGAGEAQGRLAERPTLKVIPGGRGS